MATIKIPTTVNARFAPGQLVHHRLFDYRGVIFDVDPVFSESEEWYEKVARSRPAKDQPWYRVLPDGKQHTTYVAERNLELDMTAEPIDHPLVEFLFAELEDGTYTARQHTN